MSLETNASDKYDYEGEREKLKLNSFSTCILVFKASLGIGIFTYQYAFSSVTLPLLLGRFFLGTDRELNRLLLCNLRNMYSDPAL